MARYGWWAQRGMAGLVPWLLAACLLALVASSATSAAVGTSYTVDSTADAADASVGNGVCADATGACTLRAAIQESNASAGATDTIAFALPSAPFSIAPTTNLPAVTDPVVIDGSTQPGFVDRPIVELRGDANPTIGSTGLNVRAGDSVVRSLVVNRFDTQIALTPPAGAGDRIVGSYVGTDVTGTSATGGDWGVRIFTGTGHVIGGAARGDRNVISGVRISAVDIGFAVGTVTIQGNYIGTNAGGDAAVLGALSPGAGIVSNFNQGPIVIGGADPGEGNLISGNEGNGIDLFGGSAHQVIGNMIGTDRDGESALPNANGVTSDRVSNVRIERNVISGNRGAGVILESDLATIVQGNKIGVDVDGLDAIPNGDGIYLTATIGALVGGTTEAARNIISGNGSTFGGFGDGIHFFNEASRNTIQGNFIGVDADGGPLGNRGSGIVCCNVAFAPPGKNLIGGLAEGAGNLIAHNRLWGITIPSLAQGPLASILGNSIHSNGELGINLGGGGPAPNDAGDVDVGPNGLQNFPVVKEVTSNSGQTLAGVSLNSTPGTEFRLEFFRNDTCNTVSPFGVRHFFGEGQTLVGAHQVTTDPAGDWNGVVALTGQTSPTEVITATATQFAEPGVTLAGSTSEFSECLADLSIVKLDEPDPVAVGAPLTYTIDVENHGPAPAYEVRVTDTLPSGVTVTSITPSQGSCSQSGSTVTCVLGLIARDGSARITIVLNPGSTPRTITNTARVSSELRDHDGSDDSASATTQVVTGGTIVVEKQTLPDGASQCFVFTGDLSGELCDGQRLTRLVPAGRYSSTEVVPAGWDLGSIACNDADSTGDKATATATFNVVPGETVVCTFTDVKRGSVTLRKTTNGLVDPARDICFVLTGPRPATGGVSRCTFGDPDGVLEWLNVVPGAYTICESPVPAGFTSFWKLNGVVVTPYNPDASLIPPEDLGNRCYDFELLPGGAPAFEVDNSRPGGDPRTIGYWKNWNRCTSGNQSGTAARNGGAAAGFFLVEDLLPQLVGDFSVTSCQQAVKLLSKQDQAGRNKGSDAAYELGSQLLAARFNLAAGAETCAAVQQALLDGQSLLDGINFSGSGDYLGSKSKSPLRPQALALAGTIDRYNNGNLC